MNTRPKKYGISKGVDLISGMIHNRGIVNNEEEMTMKVESVTKLKGKQYTFKKAPRDGSKLSTAVKLLRVCGTDSKDSAIDVIVKDLGVTKTNASIYFAKAKAIIEAGL